VRALSLHNTKGRGEGGERKPRQTKKKKEKGGGKRELIKAGKVPSGSPTLQFEPRILIRGGLNSGATLGMETKRRDRPGLPVSILQRSRGKERQKRRGRTVEEGTTLAWGRTKVHLDPGESKEDGSRMWNHRRPETVGAIFYNEGTHKLC